MNVQLPCPDTAHCPGEAFTVIALAWVPNDDGSAAVVVNWACSCGHVEILEAHHQAAAEPRAASAGLRTSVTVREGARARREVRAMAYGNVAGLDTRVQAEREQARDILEQLRANLKEIGHTRHDEIDGEIDTLIAELDEADKRDRFNAEKGR